MSVTVRYRKLKIGKRPYLDIYHEGERTKETIDIIIKHGDPLRSDKLKLIEKIRSQKEIELLTGEFEFERKKLSIDFIEYYEKFYKEYQGKDSRLVKYSLVKLKEMIGSSKFPLSKLNKEFSEKFAAYLRSPKGGLRGESVYNYFQKFKRVINQLIRDGYLERNPAHGISIKRNVILKKNILTSEELQMAAKTPCARDEIKRAFLFACYSGIGLAEFRNLRWQHIQNNKLIILRAKTGEQMINDLHPSCKMLIGARGSSDELVFNLPSSTAISKHLSRWIKDAGIEKHITFYCGRHTFATQLLLNGASLKTVADCLGHASTDQTVKYLNYVDSLKTKAISSLPDISVE